MNPQLYYALTVLCFWSLCVALGVARNPQPSPWKVRLGFACTLVCGALFWLLFFCRPE